MEYIDDMVLHLVNDFIFLYVFGSEETKDTLDANSLCGADQDIATRYVAQAMDSFT
jgi:hypothetical protein